MPWHYKDPRTFSARFPAAMLEAVATPCEPIVFSAYASELAAYGEAERFRWFRWCLRQAPEANVDLSNLAFAYNFRTRIKRSLGVYTLYLTAKPEFARDLLTNNPDLETLI